MQEILREHGYELEQLVGSPRWLIRNHRGRLVARADTNDTLEKVVDILVSPSRMEAS